MYYGKYPRYGREKMCVQRKINWAGEDHVLVLLEKCLALNVGTKCWSFLFPFILQEVGHFALPFKI